VKEMLEGRRRCVRIWIEGMLDKKLRCKLYKGVEEEDEWNV
jgi:hypothetical protein